MQKVRIQKLVDGNADSHDIKKQHEVLDETLMMIPDTQNRLAKALDDLSSFIVENFTNNFRRNIDQN